MGLRRSERMVVISNYLANSFYRLTSLNTFAEKYEATKSLVSEDVVVAERAFGESGIGEIETATGVSGGAIFTPGISDEEVKAVIEELCDRLSESNRILPGGYVHSSDLLSISKILQSAGRIVANTFKGNKADAVMTVATKNMPSANAVANVLNVPFVIVRRDPRITEGSAVSANCADGSSGRIEKIFLSKCNSKPNSRVLIVGDFFKSGGAISGVISLLKEFDSTLVGVAVFAENTQEKRGRMTYRLLLKVSEIGIKNNHIKVETSNTFD